MTADSKKIDDGGSAFPGARAEQVGNLSDYGPTDDDAPTFAEVHHPGMTLRDWFAGQALAGLYACRDLQLATLHDQAKTGAGDFDACMAKQAYSQADAMIAARKAGA
ncbi:hypothetical protein [Agrobacterium radiobacter]|uniref:hypothetical protein n=1 Tax=Agrobacterium radiobacter TaxID=362 RepID=UPI003CEA9DF8